LKLALAKWIAIGLAVVLFAAWAGMFIFETSFVLPDEERYYCLFDDAMVSMRYAWNLSHGEGLVWNPGQRVEGITNLLWTLYMALYTGALDKPDAVLAIQISCLILLLVAAFFAMKVGESLLRGGPLQGRRFLAVLFFVCALGYYPFNYWSLMGMETALQAVLIFAGVWIALRIGGRTRRSILLPVVVGLAFVTRPDSAVYIALIMLHRLSGIFREPGWRKAFLLEVGLIALVVVGASIFRLAYYGSLVPNTYTLKMVGYPLELRIENGLLFLDPFWRTVAAPLTIGAIALILGWHRDRALVLGVVVCALIYQIYVGGDAWRHWRLTAPFVPLLLVLATADVAKLLHRWAEGGVLARLGERRLVPSRPYLEYALVCCVCLAVGFLANDRFEEEITFEREPSLVKYHPRQVGVALALSEIALPGATVGVSWAGTVPYYSEIEGVDFLGKTDRHVASLEPDFSRALGSALAGMRYLPGHAKYDLEYSIGKLKPTYVQFDKWGRDDMRKFVRKHYKYVAAGGVPFRVLRDSPHIRWDKVGWRQGKRKKKRR
jgi:hypothetical protein